VAPYPIDWNDTKRFYHFAGFVLGVAKSSKIAIPIRWGGDWDSDNDLNDQTFMDLVHWELKI
jgi:peptidoglycan L-alanyl-D-glutamate endopeptidase CwlK